MTYASALPRAARQSARRPLPLLAALALALALAAVPASAQRSVAGRVVKAGQPVPAAAVELHQVSQDTSGVVARTAAGPDGAFRFTLPTVADTTQFVVFFATAMVDGVRYFGAPLHPGDEGGTYQVVAYDTTSAAAAVQALRVSRRDVIVSAGTRGAWEVAEAVRVENPQPRTVVGPGGRPVFGVRIPGGAKDFQAEQPVAGGGAGASQDVVLMGDRVLAAVPLMPGGRDFLFRYRVGASRGPLSIPLTHATDTLSVYVRQPAPEVRVEGLGAGEPFVAGEESYLRYTRTGLAANAAVSLRWRRPGMPVDPRWLALGVTLAVLAGGLLLARRRRPATG